MNRVFYNKLVRDRIPDIIREKKESCKTRTLKSDAEFQQELLKKVAEEAGELSRTRTRRSFLSEYADLSVVLDALTMQMEITPAELQVALKENIARKGGYTRRLYLCWSEDAEYTSNETPQGVTQA